MSKENNEREKLVDEKIKEQKIVVDETTKKMKITD